MFNQNSIILEGGQAKVILKGNNATVQYQCQLKNQMPVFFQIKKIQSHDGLDKVIQIKKIDKNNSTLVLERAEQNLKEYLKDTVLLQSQKYFLMKEIAEGLYQLHSKNIIHRDLKEENILLQGDMPKIGDLGLVREINKSVFGTCFNSQNIAPEIIQGNKCSFPSDIYSLGLLFYYIQTKENLDNKLSERDQQNILQKQKQDNQHPEIFDLIQEMIYHTPSQRKQLKQIIQWLNQRVDQQSTQELKKNKKEEKVVQKNNQKIKIISCTTIK